ncbi:MAG: anthranilate synthase component II [Bacteroidota bacterium]
MNILILDNYDSFTFNLHHYVALKLDENSRVSVFRNDQIDCESAFAYDGIILSPGPGLPSEAGIMPDLLRNAPESLPILGICLGHQAIGVCHGARLINLPRPLHGIQLKTTILNMDNPILRSLPTTINSGHYHSWVFDSASVPDCISVDAVDSNGNIMAISHTSLPQHGIQFHPESVMTDDGLKMIENWLEFCLNFKPQKMES